MSKKKKLKGFESLGGMVFSTDPDYKPEEEYVEDESSIDPSKQKLYVSYDKKHRKGKVVTLVEGFEGALDELETLGKHLKSKCGTGGSVKEGEIIIQGNFVQKVIELLEKEGYKVKKKGG